MTKTTLITVVALALVAGCGSKKKAASSSSMHGVRLIYEIDHTASPFAPDSAERSLESGLEILRKHIDALKLDQPNVHVREGRIIVELPPIPEEQLARLRTLFAQKDLLEFRMVATELTQTRAWVRTALDDPNASAGIRTDIDNWVHYESHDQYQDAYLAAGDRKTLERFVTEVALPAAPLPDRHRVVYEHQKPLADSTRPAEWRTYVVDERAGFVPVFTEAHVEWDDTTNQPLVIATLDRSGATEFAELTRTNVGRKLAIIIGDNVNSAPIIQSEIGGGKVMITMGASAPAEQQREAEDLVVTLRSSALQMPLVLARIEQF